MRDQEGSQKLGLSSERFTPTENPAITICYRRSGRNGGEMKHLAPAGNGTQRHHPGCSGKSDINMNLSESVNICRAFWLPAE